MRSIRQLTQLAFFTPALCAIFRRQNGNQHDIITEAPDKLLFQTDLPSQTIQDTGIGVFISGKEHSVTVQVFGADSNQFNTPDAQAAEQTRPAAVPQAVNEPTEDADVDLDSDTIVGLIADQLASQAAAKPTLEDSSDFVVFNNDREDDFPEVDDGPSQADDKALIILSRRGLSLRDIHKKLVGAFEMLRNGFEEKSKVGTWTGGQDEKDKPENALGKQQGNRYDGEDDDEDYDEDDTEDDLYTSSDFDGVDSDNVEFLDANDDFDF